MNKPACWLAVFIGGCGSVLVLNSLLEYSHEKITGLLFIVIALQLISMQRRD